jgi:hypothetical protein
MIAPPATRSPKRKTQPSRDGWGCAMERDPRRSNRDFAPWIVRTSPLESQDAGSLGLPRSRCRMFVGGALFGLMSRLRCSRRGAQALLRRCVEYHAVEYHGLWGFGMNGRNAYTQDKSHNCQELHRSTPISMDMYFAGSSRRTARKVVVKLRGQSINAVCQERNSGAGESNVTSGDARSASVKSDVVAIVL